MVVMDWASKDNDGKHSERNQGPHRVVVLLEDEDNRRRLNRWRGILEETKAHI